MKFLIISFLVLSSTLSWAQSLQDFSGDYTLNYSLGACNPNARVEVQGTSLSIVNQDQRDNRGWSTQELKTGEKKIALARGTQLVTKVSIVKSQVIVERRVMAGSSEKSYEKDTYSFVNKNGRKSLMISLSVEARGNIAGYSVSCGYEKK